MKSAFFFGVLLALVMMQAYVSVARADGCEVTVEDIGGRNYTRIFVGTGTAKRSPTMDEVFDAMNVKNSSFFKDLKFVSGRSDQPLVYVETPKAPLYYDFQSLPKPGPNDPKCKDKIQTGYDCRVLQLKEIPEAHGLPKGIKTGIAIAVPQGEDALLERISKGLGCDALYSVDGSSAIKAKGKSVPLVSPSGGTGTAP